MKKIMIISLVVIVCVAMAAPVFAEHTWNGTVGTTAAVTTVIAGATFAPSTGVYVSATTDALGTQYAVTAVHNSSVANPAGKAFGALSTDSTIKYSLNPATVAACATSSSTALPSLTWAQ